MRSVSAGRLTMIGLIVGMALLAAALWLGPRFDVDAEVMRLLQWIEAQGAWAPLVFIALLALVTLFLLPSYVLTIGAGFLFGILAGTAYVVIGMTLGAIVAFLAGRHLLGARARRFLRSRSKLDLARHELARGGWRIVLLTRLIPFFPGKPANYVFGLGGFSLGGFTVGTLVGLIPFSLHNAYLGSIAGDLATGGIRSGLRSPVEWAVYGIGFLATVAAAAYIGRRARQALAKHTSEERRQGSAGSCRG